MKKTSDRRTFLRTSAIAASGIALLSTQTVEALTNDSSPFEGYNPFAEEKTDLRTFIFGKSIQVSGTVYDASGNFPEKDVQLEVWHLSPNSSKFRHRAKLKTDALGRYRFITDVPNNEKGKMGRIYFRVSKGDYAYFTELAVSETSAQLTAKHWEENNQLKEGVYLIRERNSNQLNVTFNIAFNK
ncbi:MAG: hypothetical protein KTR22_03090 [Flavobacteriaceae bacterium]|nr:hypothetical protein [Flavobacteriaceae bacterium]